MLPESKCELTNMPNSVFLAVVEGDELAATTHLCREPRVADVVKEKYSI